MKMLNDNYCINVCIYSQKKELVKIRYLINMFFSL